MIILYFHVTNIIYIANSVIINAVVVINLKVECEYNKRDLIKKLNLCFYAIKKSNLTVKGFEPISPINTGYSKKYKK